jgi:hypothetical protein
VYFLPDSQTSQGAEDPEKAKETLRSELVQEIGTEQMQIEVVAD